MTNTRHTIVNNNNNNNNNSEQQCINDGVVIVDHHHVENVPKIAIGWRNLRYQVTNWNIFSKKKRQKKKNAILQRLNGHFVAGTLNALMGPSGAGKTTLLNVLCGNTRVGLTNDTELYINHRLRPTSSSSSKAPMCCFVEQHVHQTMMTDMTVGELWRYAYRFKNGHFRAVMSAMEQHIAATLESLLLPPDILNRLLGKCSGGEQKRVAIGQELMCLTAPSLMMIDEPTTGLDSAAALVVMQALHRLTAQQHITVITSIHLPSQEILHLFDRLYVLAKGGVCVYAGPPNGIECQLKHQLNLSVPNDQPPIETLISIACEGPQNASVQTLANRTLQTEHNLLSKNLANLPPNRHHYQPHKPFHLYDLRLHLCRLAKNTFIAKYRANFIIITMYCSFFLILSTVFDYPTIVLTDACFTTQEVDNSTCGELIKQDSMYKQNLNYLGYSFCFIGVMVCLMSTFSIVNIKIFRAEHRNQWYSLMVHYCSSTLITLFEVTFYSVLLTALAYFLSSQHATDEYEINWRRLKYYGGTIWLLCVYMQTCSQLFSTILVDHFDMAVIVCNLFHAFVTLFNGYFVPINANKNLFVKWIADILGLHHLGFSTIYAIYGIDRCDTETQTSFVLYFFGLDSDANKIIANIIPVVWKLLCLRALTFVLFYAQFNTNWLRWLTTRIGSSTKNGKDHPKTMMPINFEQTAGTNGSSNLSFNSDENDTKGNTNNTTLDPLVGKIIIAWRHLYLYGSSSIFELSSNERNETTPILCNLCGQLRFGTLNALMGTSGAGKTSLLRVLNGQYKTRLDSRTQWYLSRYAKIETCFITQEVSGHLLSGLTAKELLVFASRLKNVTLDNVNVNANANTKIDHEAVAMRVLAELDLLDTENTEVDRCSGGERKRLALGLELTATVRVPNLICIDEPTSGLDSASSEVVVATLCRLVRRHPICIVASIHQPNTRVLSMFDQLYVLARGGVCIYDGPVSGIQTQLDYHQSTPTPTTPTIPIEQLINYSCAGHGDPMVQALVHTQMEQTFDVKLSTELQQNCLTVPDGVQRNRCRFSSHSVTILFFRNLAHIRGYKWLEWTACIVNYLVYACTLRMVYDSAIANTSGCVNIQDDFNSSCNRAIGDDVRLQEDVDLIQNAMYNFFLTFFYLFFLMIQSSLDFRHDLQLMLNEHRNGWYSAGVFYLVKSLIDTLPLLPLNLIYIYIGNIYELDRPGIYWYLVGLFTLSAIAIQGMGHISALIARGNIPTMVVPSVIVLMLFAVLCNFFISMSKLHVIYQVIAYFSINRYLYESLSLLQYGFDRCAPEEIQKTLYVMELNDGDLYRDLALLTLILILFRMISWSLLYRLVNPRETQQKRAKRIGEYLHRLKQPQQSLDAGIQTGLNVQLNQLHIKMHKI